jgi:hypothetical protein
MHEESIGGKFSQSSGWNVGPGQHPVTAPSIALVVHYPYGMKCTGVDRQLRAPRRQTQRAVVINSLAQIRSPINK